MSESPGGAAGWADSYCGSVGIEPWLGNILSPCWFESAAAAGLITLLVLTVLIQRKRIAKGISLSRSSGGTTGAEGAFIALSFFILLIHCIHLSISLAVPSLRNLLFHLLYHGAALAGWLTVMILSVRSVHTHVPLDFRPFSSALCAIYLYSIFSFFQMYLRFIHGEPGGTDYPISYLKTSTWTA